MALLCMVAGLAAGQQVTVEPSGGEVLLGDPLRLTVDGLASGTEVTLRAQRVLGEGARRRLFRAEASFVAGPQGRVEPDRQPSLAGSYRGIDPRGLFWSMVPVPGEPTEGWHDGEVRIEARRGEVVLARASLTLRAVAPTLRWRDATPFPGARLALPAALPTSGKLPAVIALGGSEGDAGILDSAGLLASRGFAVLGLPYYSPPKNGPAGPLPAEFPALPEAFAEIPADRIDAAREWLAAQPEVDAKRVAIYGVSKGAEFALIAASRLHWPASVVAIAPSDVVWEGWGRGVERGTKPSFSWQGRPLEFLPYRDFDTEFDGFRTGEPIVMRRFHDKGRAAFADRMSAARIPVENYAGPLLLVAGHDDQVWDAGAMAENIVARRAAAGRETEALIYRDAGHALSGTGWGPTTQYNAHPIRSGGSPVADARAQADAYGKVIAFLRRTLAVQAR